MQCLAVCRAQCKSTDDILMAKPVKPNVYHVSQGEIEYGMLERGSLLLSAFTDHRCQSQAAPTFSNEANLENFRITEFRVATEPRNHLRAARNLIEDRNGFLQSFAYH